MNDTAAPHPAQRNTEGIGTVHGHAKRVVQIQGSMPMARKPTKTFRAMGSKE